MLATLFLYNGLDHLVPAEVVKVTSSVRRVRIMAHVCKGFIFLAAFSGTEGEPGVTGGRRFG